MGELLGRTDLTGTEGMWQHHAILCRRIAIHTALKNAATSVEGAGPPVKLHLHSRVFDVIAESATLIFKDGSTASGDLIIGADGVKVIFGEYVPRSTFADCFQSVTRTRVHKVKPFPSGKSAYRFLVDRKEALKNPKVRELVDREGEFSIWYGQDRLAMSSS